jgi:hypothetical protein
MTSDKDNDNDKYDPIQQEILSGRKFSLADLIGREGGGFLKGESPVPKLEQVKAEIKLFIDYNLADLSGALQAVLYHWVREDDTRVSRYLDAPLIALREIIVEILDNQNLLYEFVRQVDIKWSQMNHERPYFQRPGQLPHPEDEYTHESVRKKLVELLDTLPSQP